jgi:CPA1 family monovalent cation:H+ antiporter
MRGVDSLAVALAIPFTILSGEPFPHRDLILFVTFGVIIFTLVGQGLMLPYVVCWLGLNRIGKREHKDEIKAELRARKAALKQVERRLKKAIKDHDLPDEAIEHLRTRHQSRVQILPTNLTEGLDHMRRTAKVKAELIDAEREFIYKLLRDGKITDEARRRIEYELDLEEASVANRGKDGGGWM